MVYQCTRDYLWIIHESKLVQTNVDNHVTNIGFLKKNYFYSPPW